mmetsp:Transcript_93898/g.298049  ORF Transcript_93898/g.298049 Transcript_93898/m.298049 type:complete len:117 (-) Transcript_93898:18-368(-)
MPHIRDEEEGLLCGGGSGLSATSVLKAFRALGTGALLDPPTVKNLVACSCVSSAVATRWNPRRLQMDSPKAPRYRPACIVGGPGTHASLAPARTADGAARAAWRSTWGREECWSEA